MSNSNFTLDNVPLEKIYVGMQVSYSQTVTDADIKSFSGVSGDRNPVHLDEEYAYNSRFKKRIAHGMMTASYFSGLFGTKIPGAGCVYTAQSLNFKRPIYIDDTVTATVIVTSIDIKNRRVRFKTVCKVKGKVVTNGEAEIYIPLSFKKLIINSKIELLKYKEKIFELYKNSFNNAIDEDLWQWAYINNPNGDPLVSLYFDGEKLVGHYAVIPMRFLYQQKNINGVLSMTTMVDVSYRKYGVFVDQARDIYEQAKDLGYKFVCGFPNKKSAPGFKKRLGWTLEENLYVAKLNYDELQNCNKNITSDSISFNIKDKENINWRLRKPNQNYFNKHNNIIKKFEEDFDLVFNNLNTSMLDKDKEFNLLLDSKIQKYLDKKKFDYIFGYRIFDSSLDGVVFKKDLVISDVF